MSKNAFWLVAAMLVGCAGPARSPEPSNPPVSVEAVPADAARAVAPSDASMPPDAAALSCHRSCAEDVIDNRPCGHWEQLGPRPDCGKPVPCPSRPPRWIECDPRCCSR